jgi:hypothetical protein
MPVSSDLDIQVAVEALRYACLYDTMRLETYRDNENLTGRIQISSFGSAVALRFDDVAYFNRVYCADESVFENLAEIEDFFSGSPFGCELVGPPLTADTVAGRSVIARPGWVSAASFAWMYAPDLRLLSPVSPAGFAIQPPQPAQRRRFLTTYLRAFEAKEDRIPAALRNMRHLFDRPELEFLMAWKNQQPAGIGIFMCCGDTALLCAGAALPQFREMGCHTALLAARIRLASTRGCRRLFSWALHGGQSQANMHKAGLVTVGVTPTWRLSPLLLR